MHLSNSFLNTYMYFEGLVTYKQNIKYYTHKSPQKVLESDLPVLSYVSK